MEEDSLHMDPGDLQAAILHRIVEPDVLFQRVSLPSAQFAGKRIPAFPTR